MTDDNEAARIGVRARVQRLFSPELSHRTRPPVDCQLAEEYGFEC
jgi:hypothetical protein